MMIIMGILIAALVAALTYVFLYKDRLDRISEIAKSLVDENNRLEERYNALRNLHADLERKFMNNEDETTKED